MNFLVDENVESPIVEMLRRGGHDVLYMAEIATHTMDDVLLAQANAEGESSVDERQRLRRIGFPPT